jgi:hypothetical protein
MVYSQGQHATPGHRTYDGSTQGAVRLTRFGNFDKTGYNNTKGRDVRCITALLTANSLSGAIMAEYILVHGIRVAKDHELFTPEVFGRLTTVGPKFLLPEQDGHRRAYQVCECSCGAALLVGRKNLTNGMTKSCGCLQKDAIRSLNKTHGMSQSPEYKHWKQMNTRCHNKNCKDYPDYGGRGIQVCDRWKEPNGQGFMNFLADMGKKQHPTDTVERLCVDGDYGPGNCKWATPLEQARNTRKSKKLTMNGVTKCLSEWLESTPEGISKRTVTSRIRLGWSLEDAFNTPVGARRKRG